MDFYCRYGIGVNVNFLYFPDPAWFFATGRDSSFDGKTCEPDRVGNLVGLF
jgi:hypothetical protein